MTIQEELLAILNQIPSAIEKAFYQAMVLRHPGHGTQKVHGNRQGGDGIASGEPLSKTLNLSKIPKTKPGQSVKDGISAIEEVHGVKGLSTLPVVMNSSTTTHGTYTPGEKITVTKNTWATESTVVHEMGHYLDHKMFPPGDKFSSCSAKAGKDFDALDSVLQSSKTVKGLQEKAGKSKHQYDKYLVQRNEIFARAYTQYISVRSSNKELKSQVAELKKQHGTQWDDDEFEPIASAFDTLFISQGLRE